MCNFLYFVACGFCSGESKWGKDPLLQKSVPLHLGHTTCMEFTFWIGWLSIILTAASLIVNYVDGSANYSVAGCVILGSVVIITMILRMGKYYIIVDPDAQELIFRDTGCFYSAYRNKKVIKLSQLAGFWTKLDHIDDGEVFYALFIQEKDSGDGGGPISTSLHFGTIGAINRRCYKLEQWYLKNKAVPKDLTIHVNWLHKQDVFFDMEWLYWLIWKCEGINIMNW